MKEVICYVWIVMMNDTGELTLRPTENSLVSDKL